MVLCVRIDTNREFGSHKDVKELTLERATEMLESTDEFYKTLGLSRPTD